MKKLKITFLVSECFKAFLIFLLCFIWFNYFLKNRLAVLLISCLFTFLACSILFVINSKKNRHNKLRLEEKQKMQDCIFSLIFDDDKNVVEYFFNLAKSKHQAVKKSKYVVVKHQDGDVVLFPFFCYKSFDYDNLIYAYNKAKCEKPKRLVIATNKIDQKVVEVANKLDIATVVLDGQDCYEQLIKKYQYFPNIKNIVKAPESKTYKDIVAYSLNKNRSKSYFLSSIMLLFSSFFVRYSIYYIIVSSVLLILCFVSFCNPKFNVKQNVELL